MQSFEEKYGINNIQMSLHSQSYLKRLTPLLVSWNKMKCQKNIYLESNSTNQFTVALRKQN